MSPRMSLYSIDDYVFSNCEMFQVYIMKAIYCVMIKQWKSFEKKSYSVNI